MGQTAVYSIEGQQIAYYQPSPVGQELWGYTGGGSGNYSGIIAALDTEIGTIVNLANNSDFTTQQRLDFYQGALDVLTSRVSNVFQHSYYWSDKYWCCQGSLNPFKNCVKKCGHSRKMIGYLEDSFDGILSMYKNKAIQIRNLLENEQAELEQNLNNQQLVAQTNYEIGETNELLLYIQEYELEVKEKSVESNVRTFLYPFIAVIILAILYYNAFIKK